MPRASSEKAISKQSSNRQQKEEIKRLLAQISVIRSRCDLDLIVFLYRHPRTLLTNEYLAAFVGYEMKQVARSIDVFIDAGLLERIQTSMHAARMYLLVLDGPKGGGLTALLKLASTRQGRRDLLQILDPGGAKEIVDIAQEKRRLYAIA